MERGEAEAIYEQGCDVVVAVLRRMDEQIETLTAKVVAQDERIGQARASGGALVAQLLAAAER